MLTLLNICILMALLIMVAIWATYGFFSAFIQLIIIIGAGVLALALWEPVSYMLLGRMPAYAHGVGLLAPFAILLIVLRVAFDKLCRATVHMPRIAHQIGGGACGFFSGVLAFGMVLNGANFMPLQREILGWEPYKIQGNQVTENPDGQLWGFLRINEWSAGFFNTISVGSMSPTGGTSLAEGRPDLAKRAILTRLPNDPNQFRTAHPGSVQVTGVYAIPATEEAIYGLAQRSAILSFLKPSYTLPDDIVYGEDGMGIVNAILDDLASRAEDPKANGKPSDLLNVQAILDVARTPQFKFQSAANPENFPQFVEMVADKMGQDQVRRLGSVMGKGKVLYVVDTLWNNEYPGTYNSDAKLRIAIPQVSLQTDDDVIAPIGYSIEYSQNTGGRIFTEIISDDADVTMRDIAYSKYTELHMGWVFGLSEGQKPARFYVRELRFDLSKLEKPEGQEKILNQNIGAFAHALGAPLLPSPADVADGPDTPDPLAQGVKIAGTDIYADVSEDLPGAFSGSAVSLELDKDADPWLLISGRSERVIPGRGGKKSSVRKIQVASSDRLVRLKLDPQKAKSLYGRALGLAESLNVLRVKDEGGNFYDAAGFAMLRADRSMHVDIRDEARNRGLSANELPDVKAGSTLMVYFQVPIGTKLTSYVLGSKEQKFEETLVVSKRSKR